MVASTAWAGSHACPRGTRPCLWDTWVIDGLVNVLAFMVKIMSWPARIVQTGLVQNYAWFITAGVLAFLVYYLVHV